MAGKSTAREALLHVLGLVLLLPLPAFAGKAECRIDNRVVSCALVQQCVRLGGTLREREGSLMCCFADERCASAGSLANDVRPRPEPPRMPPVKKHASPRPEDSGR